MITEKATKVFVPVLVVLVLYAPMSMAAQYHVDGVDGNDLNSGSTRQTAFATIQKGVDRAHDGDVVVVWPDIYTEQFVIIDKSITVRSAAEAAVLETPGVAVALYAGDAPQSTLRNFVIRGCYQAIYSFAANPVITNITIVDNEYGISAFAESDPDINHCILWNNGVDMEGCQARYSCIESGDLGVGNFSVYPEFADLAGGDYHLRSEYGRYVPVDPCQYGLDGLWAFDEVTSPCVDAGDYSINPAAETMPNGGRVNIGAYGNTAYASMSPWPIEGDVNRDGVDNMIDLAIVARDWLEVLPWKGYGDSQAPNPNPSEWLTTPHVSGADSISMTAVTAVDPEDNGVEYFFECVSGACHDSLWQDGSTYEDTGLATGTYTYRVATRDKSPNQNQGGFSDPAGTTIEDWNPPVPNPSEWLTVPHVSGADSISMTAVTAVDPEDNGVEYFFECVSGACHHSLWQDSSTYEDTGLAAGTYWYRVATRDKSPNQNTGGPSTIVLVTLP